jgi:uncharacterized protein YjcR
MSNGKCHYHGGASTGAPTGNQNAVKHGIYSAALLEHEHQEYDAALRLRSLAEDVAMARIRLLRAEKVHKGLELKRHRGERIDEDELERSFRRCDALARTVGHLEIQQVRVLEVRDMQEKVEALEERAKKYVGRGPRA